MRNAPTLLGSSINTWCISSAAIWGSSGTFKRYRLAGGSMSLWVRRCLELLLFVSYKPLGCDLFPHTTLKMLNLVRSQKTKPGRASTAILGFLLRPAAVIAGSPPMDSNSLKPQVKLTFSFKFFLVMAFTTASER